jgi:hypothetical protein
MVAELGLDPALRLISIIKRLDGDQLQSRRHVRDPNNPDCFLYRYQPLVVAEKGGWFACTFAIQDQVDGSFIVMGFRSEYHPIGPLRMGKPF